MSRPGSCAALAARKHEHTEWLQGHVYTVSIQVSNELRVAEGSALLSHMNKADAIARDGLDLETTSRGATAQWTCTSKLSDKGERNCMELRLEVEEFGRCVLPLSAKVYGGAQGRAAQSGLALKSVIAKFKRADDESVTLKMQQWLHS